jgi:acetylornithine deacetylase
MPQPSWRDGGAVNAIGKATKVLEAVRRLNDEWKSRDDLRHGSLSPTSIVATAIRAGEWSVTYPSMCRLTFVLAFPPAHADGDGSTSVVEAELRDRVDDLSRFDDWLAENPPRVSLSAGVVPMHIPHDTPIVSTVSAVAADLGFATTVSGLDSWYDGATFTVLGNTPAIAFGPPGVENGRTVAHTIDESSIRSTVMRMYHHRELDRRGEPFKGKLRYRYFRRGLEGPIVDLERAFHEPTGDDTANP